MANLTEIHNTLTAVGFTLPSISQPEAARDVFKGKSLAGFEKVETGGGCVALRRDTGGLYMLLTDEEGTDVPDEQDWEENLIGVYRAEDGEELFCMTARELLAVLGNPTTAHDGSQA